MQRSRGIFLSLFLLALISSSNQLGNEWDYSDDPMETGSNEESWAIVDDRIEAREEEYSRGRRQILINRGEAERERERNRPLTLPCPEKCKCPLTHEVHCTFRLLPKIPEDLPSNIEKLNLGYNSLTTLPSHVFDSNSASLRILYLHSNDIRSLNNNVFSKLNKVEVLRLSWNKITGIRKVALHGLHNVERLYLDNNRLSFIHPLALRGLTNLKLLQLDGNRLSRLHHDVFVTLEFEKYFKFSSIQYLYLSGNQFENLPHQIFDHMVELKSVYLHGNKWECTCDLEWMKRWIEEEDKYRCKRNAWNPRAPPECAVCASPPSLAGVTLQDISHRNFSCLSPKFLNDVGSNAVYEDFAEQRDPAEVTRQNEVILFHYSDFYSTRMNIRLDSHKRSVMHANCQLTRVPTAKVREIYGESGTQETSIHPVNRINSRTYSAQFDAQFDCSIEYPENFTNLEDMMTPYLDREINLTSRDLKKGEAGTIQTVYTVSTENPPDAAPTTPLTGGSISSQSKFICSPTSLVTFQSRYSSPEERILYVVFQTSFVHTHTPEIGQFSKKPWTLIKQPENMVTNVEIAIEKKTATFKCKAVGQPKPSVLWVLPGERILRAEESDGRFGVSKSGRLFIRKPVPDDSGVYRCIATVPDESGVEDSTSAAEISTVRIMIFPRTDTLDGNQRGIQTHSVEEGSLWTMQCGIQSLPNSTIGWITPDNQMIVGQGKGRSGRLITSARGKITIKGFVKSDQGIYRCVAANSFGSAEYSIHVGMEESGSDLLETVEVPLIATSTHDAAYADEPSSPPPFLPRIVPDIVAVDNVEYYDDIGGDMAITPPPIIQPLPEDEAHHHKKGQLREGKIPRGGINVAVSPVNQENHLDVLPTEEVPVIEVTEVSTTPQDELDVNSEENDGLNGRAPIEIEIRPAEREESEELEEEIAAPAISPDHEDVVKAVAGDTVTIPCSANGTPTPEIKWTFGDHSEPISSERKPPNADLDLPRSLIFVAGKRPGYLALIVEGAVTSDSRVFTCTAENEGGVDIKKVQVIISENRATTPSPRELNISRVSFSCGENIYLPCSLYPEFSASTLQWVIPDGSAIPTSSIRRGGIGVFRNGTMVIKRASTEHNGMYKCEVNQPRDYAFTSVEVTVNCFSPRIIEPTDREIEVDYGEDVEINCDAIGDPNPVLSWSSESGAPVTRGNILTINKVTENATFQCLATNSHGSDVIHVQVEVKGREPRFLPGLAASVSALDGLSARLDCRAEGIPDPTYTWYFPTGSKIDQLDLPVRLDNGSLVIHRVNDDLAGVYRCNAENDYGNVEKNVKLIVTHPTSIVPTGTEMSRMTPGISEPDLSEFDRFSPKLPTPSAKTKIRHLITLQSKYENFTKTPKNSEKTDITVNVATRKHITSHLNSGLKPTIPVLHYPSPMDPEPSLIFERENEKEELIENGEDVVDFNDITQTDDVIDTNEDAINGRDPTPSAINIKNQVSGSLMNSEPTSSGIGVSSLASSSFDITGSSMTSSRGMHKITIETPASSIHGPRLQRRRHRPPPEQLRKNFYSRVHEAFRRKKIYENHDSIIGMYGDKVLLPCKTEVPKINHNHKKNNWYRPMPDVTWTLPSGLKISGRYARVDPWWQYYMYSNGTLAIRSVKSEDAGNYNCIAVSQSERTEIRTQTYLRVQTLAPYFFGKGVEFMQLKPEESKILPCDAKGHPTPEIVWQTPQGADLKAGEWVESLSVFPNGSLNIKNIGSADSGQYICIATNNVGEARKIFHVVVTSYPPRFTHAKTQFKYVREGGYLRIHCSASGSPLPTYSWMLPNSDKISANQAVFQGRARAPKYAVLREGTLLINRATTSDTGRYYCSAVNDMGHDTLMVVVRVYK